MRHLIVMLAAVFSCAQAIAAQGPPDAAAQVLEAQAQRFRAAVARDMAALDRLIADDFAYCHSGGGVDTKALYLKAIAGGRYKQFTTAGLKVDLYGDAAVVTGRTNVTAGVDGQPLQTVGFRTIEVYTKRQGRWQITHYQFTRLAEQ